MDSVTVALPDNILEIAIGKTLNLPTGLQTDFFTDFRICFSDTLSVVFADYGLELDPYEDLPHYCSLSTAKNRSSDDIDWKYYTGYGYGDYGLEVLNNIGSIEYNQIVRSFENFIQLSSLGSFQYVIRSPFTCLTIVPPSSLSISGYFYDFSPNLRKPWCVLLNIMPDMQRLLPILNQLKEGGVDLCLEGNLNLYQYKHYLNVPIYIHRITGDVILCRCFSPSENDIAKVVKYTKASDIYITGGVCSLCTGRVPREQKRFCGHSKFASWYWDYIKLLERQKDNYADAEQEARRIFGYPRIGATRVVETYLYKVICDIFEDYPVIRNYRGKELEYLELDIWIPSVKLGIEYQGEQHYKSVKHWGGSAALKKRKENDKKKRKLCKKLNYHLVEFKAKENLTYDFILDRVRKYHPFFFRFDK